ncbi:WUN-like protein [Mya arenaria]|uniref:WUN-like protein n=1 Tax=Mya arenaria TaxID=6604 RepID=A0ABY7FXC1_MYAAR|nr:phospholipid phosphatase 1-like [Mya arenaria]WAR23801.1 WUN-like protein [Mya arenaria]
MDNCFVNGRQLCRWRITLAVIIDVILYMIVGIPVLFLFLRGTPVERGFLCDDPTLSLPYRPETVSTSVLIIVGFSVSIGVVLLVELLNTADRKCHRPFQGADELGFCVRGYGVFLVGFQLQQLIVEFVKNQLGSLRPNFLDVCQPQFNRSLCPGYINEYTCIETEYGVDEIRDSRQSFPSGHASFSMYIAVYFSLYIQRRLHVSFSRIVKLFLQFGLVFLSLICGLGRIHDNKHHPADVIVGFVVGLSTATLVFKLVGDKLLTPGKDSGVLALHSKDELQNCCSCRVTTPKIGDPETPAPLIPNEYFNDISNGNGSVHINTCNLKLNETPNVKRHMSTPITPNQQVVGD